MARKNFQSAPKPKLSLEDIEAYESSGVGKDNKPAKAQTRKSTNVGSNSAIKAPVPANVEAEPEVKEPTKRLSIDLPQSTHTRFKTACSATGKKMAKEIEDFITKRTAALEKEAGIYRD